MVILADSQSTIAAVDVRSPPRQSPLGLSVIVCCHNSGGRLATTLAHLAAQTGIAGDRWEVVLVDNASTDGTGDRARLLWATSGASAPLRIVSEPKLGLSYARNAGISAARHKIVSFVDDDNWVCPTWCATVLRLMTAHPEIGAIACRSDAAFESGQIVPPWFPSLQHGYAVGPQGEKTGWVETPLPRYSGAGISFRRDAVCSLLQRGFSTLLTGRLGKQLISGEDAEICYALGMSGHRFWYEESLRFTHFMPPGRLTDEYARQLYRGLGAASAIEDFYLEFDAGRADPSLRARLKKVAVFRYINVLGKILRYELRALLAPSGSASRSQARIEASYFKGRFSGLLTYRKKGRAIYAHIAGWARSAIPQGGS